MLFRSIEEFIDSPVRTYSSGMYMRLAFAVAINVDADVLLIDEILAVGDSAFQKKCFDKLKEIKNKGTTIVIVSHSMDQMYKICDRLIWIEGGLIKDEGVPKFIGEAYLAAMEGRRLDRIEWENQQKRAELEEKMKAEEERIRAEKDKERKTQEERQQKEAEEKRREEEAKKQKEELEQLKKNETLKNVSNFYRPNARRGGNGKCEIKTVRVLDKNEVEVQWLNRFENYMIEITLNNYNKLKEVVVAIGFTREDGIYCYGNFANYATESEKLNGEPIRFVFENTFLDGKYLLDFWVQSSEKEIYDEIIGLQMIEIRGSKTNQRGIFAMKNRWE